MIHLRYLTLHCGLLLLLQAVTLVCVARGTDLAPQNPVLLFAALNLPVLICVGSAPQVKFQKVPPPFVVAMIAIALNFVRAGVLLAGHTSSAARLLHALSAQALWLAVPAWFSARQRVRLQKSEA